MSNLLKEIFQQNNRDLSQLIERFKDNKPTLHQKLCQQLKGLLALAEVSFLAVGEILYYIKKHKTYQPEGERVTWREFCGSSEFPISGANLEAKRRKADILIRTYVIFRKKFKIEPERLAAIGYNKLQMIAPLALKEPKKIENLLSSAEVLNEADLRKEVREKGASLTKILDCPHEKVQKIISYKCLECGAVFKEPPKGSEII